MKKEIIGAVVVLALLGLAYVKLSESNKYFTKSVKAEIIDTEKNNVVFIKYNDVEYVVVDARVYNRCKDNISGHINVTVEVEINSNREKIIAIN